MQFRVIISLISLSFSLSFLRTSHVMRKDVDDRQVLLDRLYNDFSVEAGMLVLSPNTSYELTSCISLLLLPPSRSQTTVRW